MALHSALLHEHGFRHAFFTRHGGVSEPPFDSLNFSRATGDRPEAVAENVSRAAGALNVSPQAVYFLNQVHGVGIVEVEGGEDRERLLFEDGDAVLSRDDSVACGVRTADCGPVLFAHPGSGMVAAAHAGWRGTVEGVVEATVLAFRERGVEASELIAAVGPMIEDCCFEVGEDVAQTIAGSGSAEDVIVRRPGEKPHVNLRLVIESQLRDLGLGRIDHVTVCTKCSPDDFHSYRRDGKQGGRMLSAIVAKKP